MEREIEGRQKLGRRSKRKEADSELLGRLKFKV
jgi:hypothetical protein